jgi:hypothetical protein
VSRRRVVLGAVSVAGAVAIFVAVRGDGEDATLGAHRSSSTARVAPAWPTRRGAQQAQLARPGLAATSVATEAQLLAAATQLSISGRASPGSGSGSASGSGSFLRTAPPSPPARHAFSGDPHRAAALAQWQRLARSALRGCALRPAPDAVAVAVEVEVELVAAPRLQDGEWILWPRLAGVSLEGLRALSARYEPFALQACVQEALAIPLRVRLAAREPAPRIARALERLTVEL